MSANPYALLAQKKFKGDPSKLHKTSEPTPKAKTEKINQPKKGGEATPAVPAEKKREAKVISLKEEAISQPPPKQEDPAPPTKKEREAKDRHEDRSAKGDRERKGGQGVGGWDTDWNSKVQEGEAAARDAEKEEGEKEEPASPNTVEKEKEKKEEEKPTMTVEEHLKLKAKPPPTNFEVRKVDLSALKGLVQQKKNEENLFAVKPTPKPAPKAAAKPAAKPGKKEKVEEKKEEPKEEKKEEKLDLANLGFKYKSQFNASRGRGRGRSDESGEGDAEGNRGRGRGRGRGRNTEEQPAKEGEAVESQFSLNQNDFPSLS